MKILIYITLLFFAFSSCGDKGCTDISASNYDSNATVEDNNCDYNYTLKLNLNLVGNGNVVSTNDIVEFDGNTFRVETMKFYITDLGIEADNQINELLDVHLFDMEKPATHALSFEVEKKNYTNLNFKLGLDSLQNSLDQSTVATDHPQGTDNNTFWQMTGIYIFVMMEGKLNEGTDKEKSVTYHIAHPDLLKNINIASSLNFETENTKDFTLNLEITEIFNNVDLNLVLPHQQNQSALAQQLMDNLSTAFETN